MGCLPPLGILKRSLYFISSLGTRYETSGFLFLCHPILVYISSFIFLLSDIIHTGAS